MAETHIATIIKDLATATAIVAGGGWALWKWTYGEKLRKRREMASPDGDLSATSLDVSEEKVVVTLHATWRNRGSLPIELCPEHSAVEVFQIRHDKVGRLQLRVGLGVEILFSAAPTWRVYVMEPNTDSIMHEHFVLAKDLLYGFRWILCLSPGSIPGSHAQSHLACTRELIWNAKSDIKKEESGVSAV